MLETVAAITAGTVALTQGSTAVTGTATSWTSAITGLQLVIPGSAGFYTATYVSATALTLDRPFEPVSVSTSGYALLQTIYQLPIDCRTLRVIKSPVTGLALDQMTEIEFAAFVGFPVMQNVATKYIPQPDYIDPATGETYQQILLYPLPTLAQGYPLLYDQVAAGFDGVSTSNGPLAFVPDAAILCGCRSDLSMEMKNYAGATAWEAMYEKHVQGMIHADNQRRVPEALRMDPAYTQHRTQRILRGFGGTTILNDGF